MLLVSHHCQNMAATWKESSDKAGVTFWTPDGTPVKDDDLIPLLERAARALKTEDERLRQALASSVHAEQYERCGHGLSYWVFEHNLVYAIFLDWVRTHVVRWDEPFLQELKTVSDRGRPEKATSSTTIRTKDAGERETTTRRLIDLQVRLDEKTNVRLEAKWWVLNASNRDVANDVAKLKNICADTDRGVLLAFSYGDELEEDMGKAECPDGTSALMAATFDTTVYPWWWTKKKLELTKGYFALFAFELKKER